jgi:glycosyltransferase involved in cell wall biosynthesis
LEAFRALERGILQGVDRVMTYSEFARRSFIEDYGVPEDRVVRVGSSVKFDALPEPHGPAYDGRTVLFVATDFERKGGAQVLEAFARVRGSRPDARLLMVGILPPLDWSRHPGVEPVGPVAGREAMQRVYRQASVLVHPAHYDPFPSVVLEAMACGVPVIGSDVCGIPEQIGEGVSGWIVPAGDAPALAEALADALGDAARLATMGRAARERTWGRYGPDTVAANITSCICSVG